MFFEISFKQMTYHKVQMALPLAQRRKLADGQKVQIHHKHVGHGHVYHLTGMQMRKLKTRMNKGSGMRLQFDGPQIRHNIRHGTGFFDFIKNVGKAALAAAKPLIKEHGVQALNYIVDKLPTENQDIKNAIKSAGAYGHKKAFGGRVLVGGSFHAYGGH